MTTINKMTRLPVEPTFNVLIVDDNKDLVEFLKVLFTHNGYEVCWAYNGVDGLAEVRKQPVDVVVLDVMMPKMDGLQVCAQLKQINPTLPVILLTAKDDLATRSAAMALGVSEFLAKPVNIEDLLTRVRTQCHAAQWDKSNQSAVEDSEQKVSLKM
jgi:DNA-binding response OmpR family regulator